MHNQYPAPQASDVLVVQPGGRLRIKRVRIARGAMAMSAAGWFMAGLYVAGAVMLLAHGIATWREERSVGRWIATRGVILFGSALAALARGSRVQSMEHITYEYAVAGRHYRSRRFGFDSLTWRSYRAMLAYLATLCAGSQVTVYYDPTHPQRSVLDRQTSVWDYLVFIVAGVGLLVVGPYLFRQW